MNYKHESFGFSCTNPKYKSQPLEWWIQHPFHTVLISGLHWAQKVLIPQNNESFSVVLHWSEESLKAERSTSQHPSNQRIFQESQRRRLWYKPRAICAVYCTKMKESSTGKDSSDVCNAHLSSWGILLVGWIFVQGLGQVRVNNFMQDRRQKLPHSLRDYILNKT